MKEIGLYFGSFNPIHIGHLMLANYAVEHFNLDELHIIVSPQNPFKEQKNLLDVQDRIEMCKIATNENKKIFINDIETHLPIPSYTTDTLRELEKTFENSNFHIIMGIDNFISLHSWKNVENVLKHHLIVFPRVNNDEAANLSLLFSNALKTLENGFGEIKATYVENAVINNLSSTFIREEIANGKSISYYVTDCVEKFINDNNFYKK